MNNGKCPKCKLIKPMTQHHLFNYKEIKEKLLMVRPAPKEEYEHDELQKLILQIHKKIPTVPVCRGCHDKVEGEVNGKKVPVKEPFRLEVEV